MRHSEETSTTRGDGGGGVLEGQHAAERDSRLVSRGGERDSKPGV